MEKYIQKIRLNDRGRKEWKGEKGQKESGK